MFQQNKKYFSNKIVLERRYSLTVFDNVLTKAVFMAVISLIFLKEREVVNK